MTTTQLTGIQIQLRQIGWILGYTSTGMLAMAGTRRLYLDRDGTVEIEDVADTDQDVIRHPATIDSMWTVTLAALKVKPGQFTHDYMTGRWVAGNCIAEPVAALERGRRLLRSDDQRDPLFIANPPREPMARRRPLHPQVVG